MAADASPRPFPGPEKVALKMEQFRLRAAITAENAAFAQGTLCMGTEPKAIAKTIRLREVRRTELREQLRVVDILLDELD